MLGPLILTGHDNARGQMCDANGLRLFIPSPVYCTDNAVMIGAAAFHEYEAGTRSGWDLNAVPGLRLGEK